LAEEISMSLMAEPSGEIGCFGFCGCSLESNGDLTSGSDFGGVGLNEVRDEPC
jgi:hypothetical protein